MRVQGSRRGSGTVAAVCGDLGAPWAPGGGGGLPLGLGGGGLVAWGLEHIWLVHWLLCPCGDNIANPFSFADAIYTLVYQSQQVPSESKQAAPNIR